MAAPVPRGSPRLREPGYKDRTISDPGVGHMHTPPASDQSSHGGRKDDDAASSSELSDLEEEGDAHQTFCYNTTGAGPHVQQGEVGEVVPDRYEGGIPIFTPVSLVSAGHKTDDRLVEQLCRCCLMRPLPYLGLTLCARRRCCNSRISRNMSALWTRTV